MKKEYSLQIYKPNGENTDIELRKYQYNGSFMGERNITASISSPVKINWEIGDYVIFRNEHFTLRYVPPVKKQSRRGTFGEGYIYDGIVFSSIISQLMDVQFLDYVSNDNNIHYTGLSNFAFYVSNNSLTEFANRIKANIERVYGKDSWDVIVANKGVIIKDEDNNVIVEGSSFEFDDQSISITSGTSIYNAICLINTQLELNFLIRIVNGRKTIILGGSSVATAESLGYGKGRGLKSIQQSHNNNEQIVTRLHAYGSSRNLPYRYYNKKYNDKDKYPKMFDSNGNYLLESRYINKLMLPYRCWVQTSYLWDAFIQSKLADVIGIKEGEVTFDGSDEEWDEIYPSLEKQSVNDWEVGMTMYDSGYREYSETMRNRFLFNTRQMTSYGNTIEEIKKIFSLNTKNADDREQAKSILEDCKWTVTPGKEAYYEEAMKIIDEVWDGKDWDYKYDYAVQKTHKLSSTEKSNIKKYTYNGDGRLDRLTSGASIKDNGVSSDGSYTDGSTDTNGTIINTTFEVIIPQLGFDIEDWVSQDNSKATMSIKSGMCAGREFPINSCIAVDVNDYSKGWKLNLDRHQDMEVNMIFPNSVYKLSAGDEYVLTGIYMPDTYVESAENRLYEQAVKYLADIDHTKYTYNLDVDSKWMYEHEKVANLLYEGCSIVFNDFDSGDEMSGVGDLNIGEISVVATQVTISFNEESLPKYTIVLSDDKHTAVNLQEMISASVKSNTISYANSISLLEKKINDKLSKTEQDEAQELITFLKGIKTTGIENDGNNITKGLTKLYDAIMSNGFKNSMTAGSGWQIDKNGNAQVESIEVRSYMRVLELVMNRLSAEESEFIFTESGTVEKVVMNDDGSYTLTMRKKTDKDITPFQEGDILKGVVNNLAEQGTVGVNYYTSWMQVKEVNQTTNSIKVAVYADNDTPAKKNFPPCNLMVLHRWGNTTKEERQSCWYISSIEKRIVMLDGVTKPIVEESNYASFYGLPFDMNNFKGYDLNKNQPYLYVRGAFLQDVCFIDYLGKVVKQERYRGVWSQEVAISKDPYIVTQTTFDTVYHKNAKWQCNSTIGSKVEPSESTTDWTMLTDGGEAITVDSTDVYYCISPSGKDVPNDNYEGWTQIVPTPTKEKPYLWTRTRWYFSDGTITPTYTVVRNGKDGAPGRNISKVTNYYKWGVRGTEAPSDGYTKDNIPPHTDGLDYLWNYEVCYSDNDVLSQSGKTCIGYFPKDGDPGKGIKIITEYYQLGTAIKPTNSITASDKTLTVPSGWKTTMDATTNENRFVWNQEVIQFTDGTYSISVIHLAGAQGDQGIKGEDGNGMEYIYMRTEGCKAPNTPSTNGSTPTGWTKEPSGVNAEYPYEWVSMRIQDEGVWGSYSKPILWKEYYALNANLLEQTDFDGLLTKWESRSVYQGTSYEDDSINHISNDGKDGVNCYYDISSRMKYESLYKDVLIQRLVNGSVTRLKPSTWYTLSFYAKCGVNVKPVNLTSNEYGFGLRILYLEKGKRYKFSISGRIDSQAQKDGKTLWCYVYDRDWNWFKSLIIDTTSDAVKSIEFSDVPLSGTYEFRAYMYDNGGSRAGKVTLNWASVEEVDGELFSTYIYPSLVDNTKVFVDGEQKTVSSDCEVKYKASSSDWVRHTVTFKTRSTLGSKQNLLFRMLPIVMSDNTHYLKICMPKLEVGKVASEWQLNEADRMGKNGKPLVGPTEWNASTWYMSGKADNEPYQSIVINQKNPKQMYLCGYSHSGKEPLAETSTSSVDTCTEDKPWVQVPYQDFVATKVLFAERGKVENLDITNATIQGTITDMAVKTDAEWDAITNALVPKEEKDYVESNRNFQIVDPSKAGSYFIPTFYPTGRNSNSLIVFLPTYNPSTDYDIITCNTTQSNVKKRYKIPKYQTAGTHIRITKGGAPLEYSRWAYLEDVEYERLWTSNNGNNRNTIRDIYNMGTLICADHKIFKVTDGNGKHGHNITGAWYYGDSDYKHGRLSVNGTVARMLWLMPGQTVELVSQIEEIDNTKCLVWSVVNASDFTAVNINADLTKRKTYDQNFESLTPIEFHGESGILAPNLSGNVDNWEDCFIAHKKIDNLLLNGETNRIPSLFINRNDPTKDDDYPIAEFYIP